MYRQLAHRTGLAPGQTVISLPVAMGRHNTVQVDLTVISGEVKVTLEPADDLDDWSVRQAYSAVTGPGAALLGSRSIQGSHVRLRWEEATSINPATLTGGIHCSRQ
jgi:hypothetical protein